MLLEVAEHLVRLSRDRVAADAAGPAKEQHRAPLLGGGHRVVRPARIPVDRRIRVDLSKFELRDRPADVVERDRRARLHVAKDTREEVAVVAAGVETAQYLVPNRSV